MKRLFATGLVLILCVQPAFADGALTRSVAREASRLAAEDASPEAWRAVRKLAPGKRVVVTTADASLAWTLVTADDVSVTIVDLALAGIPDRARRRLGEAAKAAPEVFSGAALGAAVSVDQIRMAADGVFVDGVKVAELERLLRRVPAADVMTVSTGPERRGSAVAAVLGALGGFWLGAGLAIGLAENSRCYGSCGGVEARAWAAFIGVPFAAGYGAWYGTSRVTEEIVYRRP